MALARTLAQTALKPVHSAPKASWDSVSLVTHSGSALQEAAAVGDGSECMRQTPALLALLVRGLVLQLHVA